MRRHVAFNRLLVLTAGLSIVFSSLDLHAGFVSGQIVVLRVGDGVSNLRDRQNPVFIDQYDANTPAQTTPTFTVALPTNGTNALWMNGNAGTEGGLARSANRRLLTVAGYSGEILSKRGTPSRLPYDRAIAAIDSSGAVRLAYRGTEWYGLSGDKTNPRGTISDGTNQFWGCGDSVGTLFYSPSRGIAHLAGFSSTRALRIVNNMLYVSATASDTDGDSSGGIYSFAGLPRIAGSVMQLVVPSVAPFIHITGFDISPQEDVAYMADAVRGIVKYAKANGHWALACDFYIPGYAGANSGILTNSASASVRAGCFGLAVDFSGSYPIIYATTTEWAGYDGLNINSNRLIRIDDTNAAVGGVTLTNFGRTLAFAGATNICFRGLDFAPESRTVAASR